MNNLLVPMDETSPDSECAHWDSASTYSRLKMSRFNSRLTGDDDHVTEIMQQAPFMPGWNVYLERGMLDGKWDGRDVLVSDDATSGKKFRVENLVENGGVIVSDGVEMPETSFGKFDLVEMPPTVLLSSSASSSLQVQDGRTTKSCPTLAQVKETPLEPYVSNPWGGQHSNRHACWDSNEPHWWKRCGFKWNTDSAKSECGHDTKVPCKVKTLQDVDDDCLVSHEVETYSPILQGAMDA